MKNEKTAHSAMKDTEDATLSPDAIGLSEEDIKEALGGKIPEGAKKEETSSKEETGAKEPTKDLEASIMEELEGLDKQVPEGEGDPDKEPEQEVSVEEKEERGQDYVSPEEIKKMPWEEVTELKKAGKLPPESEAYFRSMESVVHSKFRDISAMKKELEQALRKFQDVTLRREELDMQKETKAQNESSLRQKIETMKDQGMTDHEIKLEISNMEKDSRISRLEKQLKTFEQDYKSKMYLETAERKVKQAIADSDIEDKDIADMVFEEAIPTWYSEMNKDQAKKLPPDQWTTPEQAAGIAIRKYTKLMDKLGGMVKNDKKFEKVRADIKKEVLKDVGKNKQREGVTYLPSTTRETRPAPKKPIPDAIEDVSKWMDEESGLNDEISYIVGKYNLKLED